MKTIVLGSGWKRVLALAPAAVAMAVGPALQGGPDDAPSSNPLVGILTAGISADATHDDGAAVPARTRVDLAIRQTADAIQHAADVGRAVAVAFTPGGRPRTLVLPGDHLKPEAAEEMSEDLAIMSKILGKATAGEGDDKSLVVELGGWNWKGRGGAEAFYLDGFGALFLLSVDFPLCPAAKDAGEAEAKVKDTSWEEARSELRRGAMAEGPLPILAGRLDVNAAEFRQGRVDELRDELIAALKHAVNIHGLGTGETVAVAVFGPSASSPQQAAIRWHRGARARDVFWAGAANAGGGGSVMTLRVSKGDLESLSKGRLDADAFGKRVSISVR